MLSSGWIRSALNWHYYIPPGWCSVSVISKWTFSLNLVCKSWKKALNETCFYSAVIIWFFKEMHNHQGCEIPLKNVCVCNICDLTISPRVCTAAADCCKSFVDWLINCRPEMGLQLELTGGVFLILVTARKKRINLLFMCTICSGTQKVLLCVRIYKNKLK